MCYDHLDQGAYSVGWCEMNKRGRENKERGQWIGIIIERNWSSLFPQYYSIIFLIYINRTCTQCTHVHSESKTTFCSLGFVMLIIIECFGPQYLLRLLPHITKRLPAVLTHLGRGKYTCTFSVWSNPSLHTVFIDKA